MRRAPSAASLGAWIVAIPGALLSIDGCARTLRHVESQPTKSAISELWREPQDLASRDLFHGAGGPKLRPPRVTYTFVERKTTGTNPGYDVRDPQGRLWSVKLGEEAQSEVTASRVLWAVGFHQPPTYYVDSWELSGADARRQPAARFRLDLPGHDVIGGWSWYENPFIGSRPFAALVVVNMLLKNWDLKTSNNKIYEVRTQDGVRERRYVVRDVGASLGKARQVRFFSWFPFMRHRQGSKNNLADFEAQRFVRAIEGDLVEFDYRGVNRSLVDSVKVADLRWTCELLSRISKGQWLDAFRAGGYTPAQSARYVQTIREKISEARELAVAAQPGLAAH